MRVLEKAAELGQALVECDEYIMLKAAETAMDNDVQAQEIIRKFQEIRQTAQEAHLSGDVQAEEYLQQFQEIQEQMQQNVAISEFLAAQEKFNLIMQKINLIIGKAIGTSDGCDPKMCSSCGGGCN